MDSDDELMVAQLMQEEADTQAREAERITIIGVLIRLHAARRAPRREAHERGRSRTETVSGWPAR
jgi:hypothetical protein